MGTNTIITQNDGEIIDASDINQYKTALSNDHVPRNAAGAATDEGGSIGSAVYKWLKGWFGSISIIGSVTHNIQEVNSLDLEVQSGNDLRLKFGLTKRLEVLDSSNALVATIDADGIDRLFLKDLAYGSSDSSEEFNSTGDVTDQEVTVTKVLGSGTSRMIITNQPNNGGLPSIANGYVTIQRDTGSGFSQIGGRFYFDSSNDHKQIYFVDNTCPAGSVTYKINAGATCRYYYQNLVVTEVR